MGTPRIAVIGAGPAGMSAIIQLKFRMDEGLGPYEVVGFEKQETWGGVWNYSWRTGKFLSGSKSFHNLFKKTYSFKQLLGMSW